MSSAVAAACPDRAAARSPSGLMALAAVAAMTFSASSSAPTPVYHLYQDSLGLSHLMLTLIFAVYAFSLLAGLLTVGSLSDYLGRRPVAIAALVLNAAAMALFVVGESASVLIAARAVQGLATGAALTTLSAAILDIDRARGPIVNSITPFIGLSVGSLGAGALVTFAPAPQHLVFALLLVLSLVLAAAVALMPETTTPRPGARAALRPHVRVPPQARRALARVTPLNVAGWALGGFYFSLMPSLVRTATGLEAPLVGGAVVAALTLTATLTVLAIRSWPADRILGAASPLLALGVAVSLAGVHAHAVGLLLLGTVIAGLGFGGGYAGTFRSVIPLADAGERAGLLSAYFVQSYLAFSLPAILAGVAAPHLGLPLTSYVYGTAVILLALASLAARASAAESDSFCLNTLSIRIPYTTKSGNLRPAAPKPPASPHPPPRPPTPPPPPAPSAAPPPARPPRATAQSPPARPPPASGRGSAASVALASQVTIAQVAIRPSGPRQFSQMPANAISPPSRGRIAYGVFAPFSPCHS